jgi:hypothetical protein
MVKSPMLVKAKVMPDSMLGGVWSGIADLAVCIAAKFLYREGRSGGNYRQDHESMKLVTE